MFLKKLLKDFIYFFRNLLPCAERTVILMYHSVNDNNVFFTVGPDEFQRQMKYLKKNNYQIIGLSDLVNKSSLSNKSVVLTFDDGYYDNYSNVFPVLKKYNFPATIFLTTGFIGQEMNNSQNIPLRVLDWQKIEEMHQSGLIDFEPHSVSHQRLTKQEIIESKRIIEKRLNKKCYFFAYPKGKYNQKIIEILKKNGFQAGLAIENGDDNLFELKRVSINSLTSFIQFKAKLCGR